MYGEEDKIDKAKEHKHMTMYEAAGIARDAGVLEMWLTHYSPATSRPYEFEKKIQEIFPNAKMGKDLMTKELKFQD